MSVFRTAPTLITGNSPCSCNAVRHCPPSRGLGGLLAGCVARGLAHAGPIARIDAFASTVQVVEGEQEFAAFLQVYLPSATCQCDKLLLSCVVESWITALLPCHT